MHRLRSPAALATALLAGFCVATPAEAARDRIGGAVVVEREVSGSLPGAERKVAQGDDVFLDELIRTAGASAAKLQFVDETKLSLGPLASAGVATQKPARSAVASAAGERRRCISTSSASKLHGPATRTRRSEDRSGVAHGSVSRRTSGRAGFTKVLKRRSRRRNSVYTVKVEPKTVNAGRNGKGMRELVGDGV